MIQFGDHIDPATHRRVTEAAAQLESKPPLGMAELVPAFTTVTITYDALRRSFGQFRADVERALRRSPGKPAQHGRLVHIPVCYGGEFGPDLETVARYAGVPTEEVVRIHSGVVYTVYTIGFAPGFPYLGGMPELIATPRRDSPRDMVPAGSVGIAGRQTGIYSIESPGGWQIIGRTPLSLFTPSRTPPSLLRTGDTVRFHPISRQRFRDIAEARHD